MRVLALNCGSSSIKFRLVEVAEGPEGGFAARAAAVAGAVREIGGDATLSLEVGGRRVEATRADVRDHAGALEWIGERLGAAGGEGEKTPARIEADAVGHRVVHGGDRFTAPAVIDASVETAIGALSELAPLHNPASLAGIRAARRILGPRVPMVAVFDTAFHRSLPPVARTYALPWELAEKNRVRRYGFHGIAHASLADGYAAASGRTLRSVRLITLQLGNGCSAAAVRDGLSVETSMGFTPLEGLVMGTRSGDLDPAVVPYLSAREGATAEDVERWLNERSGLLGVSGRTNDMRELIRAAGEGDPRARLAVDLFCYRAKKYVGAYLAVLGGADAIVFGGGIGEGSHEIRARICAGMEWCGLALSPGRNRAAAGLPPGSAARISADGASIAAWVVAADEETRIALETARCLREPHP